MKEPANTLESVEADAYEALARDIPGKNFIFMNHGYASIGKKDRFPGLRKEDAVYLNHIMFLRQFFSRKQTSGKTVLEVGCGRGGNCRMIDRYFNPKKVVGLELTVGHVRFCKRTHQGKNLSFVQGSAMALPFEDGSFDRILNIESSHCYSDPVRFFAEVRRVLKPGGLFFFADIFSIGDRDKNVEQAMRLLGFSTVKFADVTENAIESLSANAETYSGIIMGAARGPKGRERAENLVHEINVEILNRYRQGRWRYLLWIWKNG